MSYADAKIVDVSEIPVIDLEPLFNGEAGERLVGENLLSTVENVGFFYVKNHRIAQQLIDRVFEAGQEFYGAAAEQKSLVKVRDYHRGYLPIGEATMPGVKTIDLKESFIWGLDVKNDDPDIRRSQGLIAPNRWPDFMPKLKETLNEYFNASNELGKVLLRAFAAGMKLSHDYFTRSFSKPLTRGALIHYPPQPSKLGNEQFGVGPHTDYGCLTLLCQDLVGGLQVLHRNGTWITAHPIPETIVVNVGDLLHRWSNNKFLSNPHRVINASGGERFSVPVFVDPNWDTLIDPATPNGETPLYEAVRCGDYIRSRYEQSFAYRQQ
ncbi:MAG: isopenicillin N synthase family oxygenase [SAR324 cluster bacterium]|nr:isopenicillin N synthase family oxygenase [SAR324 cluster bacterium]